MLSVKFAYVAARLPTTLTADPPSNFNVTGLFCVPLIVTEPSTCRPSLNVSAHPAPTVNEPLLPTVRLPPVIVSVLSLANVFALFRTSEPPPLKLNVTGLACVPLIVTEPLLTRSAPSVNVSAAPASIVNEPLLPTVRSPPVIVSVLPLPNVFALFRTSEPPLLKLRALLP
ncbi:MAG: hypothetical protein BWY06_01752 [Candidatus Latescibacteria bacterium ADurb.Bin168]|nr:MAG: hypothetical protein BWY06_01752 [Candidatus Latescibacteria bacterium ADurb.Bin168]